MRSLIPPFFAELEQAQRVLIAGMGGGFDVFCGLPLYFALRETGKTVHLANLSFSDLQSSSGRELTPFLVEIDARTRGFEQYFPELHLARWFFAQGEDITIYGLGRTGVKPLLEVYEKLVELVQPDAIVLIDGGTDSLMRGDEVGLGTPEEDALSLATVHALETSAAKYVVCLGFGVDNFHGVCHAQFLEAVAALTPYGHYLGSWSLTPNMPGVQRYWDAAEHVFQAMPSRPSIVSSSVLDAIYGQFGNYHRTSRTAGTELFINPLMGLYWAFRLEGVAERNLYLESLRDTQSFSDVRYAIELFRDTQRNIKPWEPLPM